MLFSSLTFLSLSLSQKGKEQIDPVEKGESEKGESSDEVDVNFPSLLKLFRGDFMYTYVAEFVYFFL